MERPIPIPIAIAIVDSILPASLAYELGRAHLPEGKTTGGRYCPAWCEKLEDLLLPHPKSPRSEPGPVEQLFHPTP